AEADCPRLMHPLKSNRGAKEETSIPFFDTAQVPPYQQRDEPKQQQSPDVGEMCHLGMFRDRHGARRFALLLASLQNLDRVFHSGLVLGPGRNVLGEFY